MLDTAEAATPAPEVPAPPAKTTFPNGRMTAKEAWLYCRDLCLAASIEVPTLRAFKWYLQHGSEIASELVPDPFGNGERVHSIAPDAVSAFVEKLRGQGVHAVVAQKVEERNPTPARSQEKPQKPTGPIVRRGADRELDARQALDYLRARVGKNCELNQTTLSFYLAYDLIPSCFKGRQRVVRQGDLDAFIALAPDGVYANHLSYATEMEPSRGDMTMREAYAYYSEVDPTPIAMNSFRSLVAAGIIQPIRTANDPRAPVLGFCKQEINAFLALRQRILEQNKETPTTKSFLTRKATELGAAAPETQEALPTVQKIVEEAVERARPTLEAARRATEAARRKVEAQKDGAPPRREAPLIPEKRDLTKPPLEEHEIVSRYVPITDAYAYYAERCSRPYTLSWFRSKIYNGVVFRSRTEADDRPKNPHGKIYMVDLDSVDAYLAEQASDVSEAARQDAEPPAVGRAPRKSKARPKGWPVEKAYHKFRQTIPPGLSLLQFKRLVRDKMIDSFVRGDVVHVSEDAVEKYFRGHPDLDRQKPLQMGTAYTYYCSRCPDPVAKSHFSRWTMTGKIAGGEKTEDGLWMLTMERIDAFLAEHPTGRLRSNRNSLVATASAPAPKPEPKKAKAESAKATKGHVTISISSYPSVNEMNKALLLLTEQGFEVEVKP